MLLCCYNLHTSVAVLFIGEHYLKSKRQIACALGLPTILSPWDTQVHQTEATNKICYKQSRILLCSRPSSVVRAEDCMCVLVMCLFKK